MAAPPVAAACRAGLALLQAAGLEVVPLLVPELALLRAAHSCAIACEMRNNFHGGWRCLVGWLCVPCVPCSCDTRLARPVLSWPSPPRCLDPPARACLLAPSRSRPAGRRHAAAAQCGDARQPGGGGRL